MLEELEEFYTSRGIHPLNFRCCHRGECSANSPNFTEAKMSFVGPRYEEATLPRLLFLSLDSGDADADPKRHTAEAVQTMELERDVEKLPKHKHWYRTHEMAFELLRQFEPQLTIPDSRLYFAHVNSAKCCQNKDGRRQADLILFKNCRDYIIDELRILAPDVVVTQGDAARKAILSKFCPRPHDVRTIESPEFSLNARYETGLIELVPGVKSFLWLHTYHPNNFGRFNPQRRYSWPLYVEEVGRFWRSRQTRVRILPLPA